MTYARPSQLEAKITVRSGCSVTLTPFRPYHSAVRLEAKITVGSDGSTKAFRQEQMSISVFGDLLRADSRDNKAYVMALRENALSSSLASHSLQVNQRRDNGG
jgi:hypothetical protein